MLIYYTLLTVYNNYIVIAREFEPKTIYNRKGNKMIRTYSTSQIAKIVGLHPNTVRMYEEWGLIQKPERKPNGYRVFTQIHIKQFELAKKALQIEVIQAGLRKIIINVVKLSANYQFDEAMEMVDEYIRIAKKEIENAKEAAELSQQLYMNTSESDKSYKRSQVAQKLNLTIDTIRNWEMNGLLKVKRKENGYRVYYENDINRLKIIRSLRCANYSLSAILRMMNKLESEQNSAYEMYEILNTPGDDESIISVCDNLVDSLESAIENAGDAKKILEEIKKINPPL